MKHLKTPFDLTGCTEERRDDAIATIAKIDATYNVSVTQKARYHIPLWQLILATIPPSDKDGLTIREITDIISDLEYSINRHRVTEQLVRTRCRIRTRPQIVQGAARRLIGGISLRERKYNLGVNIEQLRELTEQGKAITYSFNLRKTTTISDTTRIVGNLSNINVDRD
jgi:hypothetical protein